MLVGLVALVAGACGGGAAATSSDATLNEFSISLSEKTLAAGDVTFNVANTGSIVHEFVVLKTDIAPDGIPMAADGQTADEHGTPGVTVMGEIEDLEAGDTGVLSLNLEPGKYIVMCNVEGHYAAGMNAAFTVEG